MLTTTFAALLTTPSDPLLFFLSSGLVGSQLAVTALVLGLRQTLFYDLGLPRPCGILSRQQDRAQYDETDLALDDDGRWCGDVVPRAGSLASGLQHGNPETMRKPGAGNPADLYPRAIEGQRDAD